MTDLRFSIRQTQDSQLCEHIHDDMWPRAAIFIKLDPEKTSATAKWTIPRMQTGVYHWQWLCIFVVMLFNKDHKGRFGGLVGDEMGLGKVKTVDLKYKLRG